MSNLASKHMVENDSRTRVTLTVHLGMHVYLHTEIQGREGEGEGGGLSSVGRLLCWISSHSFPQPFSGWKDKYLLTKILQML